MATDLNTVGLVGRLTRPCENRFTNSGFCITTFSLAVNRKKKAQDGSWQDRASYFDIKILGKMGEALGQYLVKGQQVSVQGYLDQETWETNGQKRSKVVIIAESVSLLGSKPQTNRQNDKFVDGIPFD